MVEIMAQPGVDDEQLRATVASVVGLEDDGSDEDKHLPRELFKELLGYMMHEGGQA